MATLARGSIYGTSKIPTKSENNDDTHQLIKRYPIDEYGECLRQRRGARRD